MIKLICGLLKKEQGEILIDGCDIDTLELDSYYNFLSYLSQDASVFDATIRENIVFNNKIPDAEVYAYLEKVNLTDKVLNLEDKLDSLIGEKGVQLSGGERQRLAIARVLAQKRSLIILDEAVSALDSINEEIVMNNLINDLKGSTLIIIAHRLQTIRKVDKIIVMKNCEIISEGTFNDLLNDCDYFRELWEKNNTILELNNVIA